MDPYEAIVRIQLVNYLNGIGTQELYNILHGNVNGYAKILREQPIARWLENMVQSQHTEHISKDFNNEELVKVGFTVCDPKTILKSIKKEPILTMYKLWPFIHIVLDHLFSDNPEKPFNFDPMANDYILMYYCGKPVLLLHNLQRLPNDELRTKQSTTLTLELNSIKDVLIKHLEFCVKLVHNNQKREEASFVVTQAITQSQEKRCNAENQSEIRFNPYNISTMTSVALALTFFGFIGFGWWSIYRNK